MPEIKHTFQAGKMNKDVDERLVPNGEYRNAINIQVRTTDGESDGLGAAGTVQNIQSNGIISANGDSDLQTQLTSNVYLADQKPVASIADEKNDVAYFFNAGKSLDSLVVDDISGEYVWIDSINRQNVNGVITPVVVDIYGVSNEWETVQGSLGEMNAGDNLDNPSNQSMQNNVYWYKLYVMTGQATRYRVGMEIQI